MQSAEGDVALEQLDDDAAGVVTPDQLLGGGELPPSSSERACMVLLAQSVAAVVAVAAALLLLSFLWSAHAPLRVSWTAQVPRSETTGALANGVCFHFLSLPTHGLCAVNVAVAAGSNDEQPGKAGVAHVLEHMGFDQAGDKRGRSALFSAFEQLGVGYNAFTTFDATVYQSWNVAGDTIATVLQLHALQMTDLVISPENVAAELGAVLGEARMRNASFGVAQRIYEFHLQGKKTQWPIGLHGDLATVTAGDLERFWRGNYSAERIMIHVVCGADEMTNAGDLKTQISKLFGGIRAGKAGAAFEKPMAKLSFPSLKCFPPAYGVSGVEAILTLSTATNVSTTPTFLDIFSAQQAAVFDALLLSFISQRFKGEKKYVEIETQRRGMLGLTFSEIILTSGANGVEYLEQIFATLISSLRQMTENNFCDTAAIESFWKKVEAAKIVDISSKTIAKELAHKNLFILPREAQEVDSELVPTLCLFVREKAQFYLNSLSDALNKDSCDAPGLFRCSLSIVTSLDSQISAESVAEKFRNILSANTRATKSVEIFPDFLAEPRGKKQHRRIDVAVIERGEKSEKDLRILANDLPISRIGLNGNATVLSALFSPGMQSSVLRIIATNRFGPPLCALINELRFEFFFSSPSVPLAKSNGVLPQISCKANSIVFEYVFSNGRVDSNWIAATLKPQITTSMLATIGARVAQKKREERENGDFDIFSKQMTARAIDCFVWGKDSDDVRIEEMDAKAMQQQLWQSLSPDSISLLYIGRMFNVSQLESALAYRIQFESEPIAEQKESNSSHIPFFFSVSSPPSEFNRTAVTVLASMAREKNLNLSVLEEVLFWKLFRTIRVQMGFSYFASHDWLVGKDRIVLAASWLVGSDYPVNSDNEKASVDSFLSAFRKPLLLEQEWNVATRGYPNRLRASSDSVFFQMRALLLLSFGDGDTRSVESVISRPRLNALLLDDTQPVVFFLRADSSSSDGVIRRLL